MQVAMQMSNCLRKSIFGFERWFFPLCDNDCCFCFRQFCMLLRLNEAFSSLYTIVQVCRDIVRRMQIHCAALCNPGTLEHGCNGKAVKTASDGQFLCWGNGFWHCVAGMQFGSVLHGCFCYLAAETTSRVTKPLCTRCQTAYEHCCRIVAVTIRSWRLRSHVEQSLVC